MPKVVAKVETAGKMHEDERIIKAVQFLRIVAVIRYNNILQTKIMNEENYNQALHIHLLLSWAAFLYEGISAFAGAGKVIKDLTYFKNNTPKVKRFFKEHGEVSSYRNRVLGPIRNQAIFHIIDIRIINAIYWRHSREESLHETIRFAQNTGSPTAKSDRLPRTEPLAA